MRRVVRPSSGFQFFPGQSQCANLDNFFYSLTSAVVPRSRVGRAILDSCVEGLCWVLIGIFFSILCWSPIKAFWRWFTGLSSSDVLTQDFICYLSFATCASLFLQFTERLCELGVDQHPDPVRVRLSVPACIAFW